jgi:hypothetical protein
MATVSGFAAFPRMDRIPRTTGVSFQLPAGLVDPLPSVAGVVIKFFGLVGTLAFLLSAFPQMVRSVHDGHSRGVSGGTIALWLTGEIMMLVYTVGALNSDALLVCNYLVNTLFVGAIAWLKVFPRI